MGTKPILPLLVSMSVPSILSMLIQSLYNVVDSIFVAWLSNDALTAVSLAYPLQNLVLAVAVGFGVGINAYIARNLGEGNQYKVDQAASMGVIFTTIHAVIFILVGLFGSEPFLRMFTDDPEILQMSVNYTRIVICLSFGSLYHIFIEKLFQAVGNMVVPMILQWRRGDCKHHSRPDSDLRHVRTARYGSYRRCCRYGNWTDDSLWFGGVLLPSDPNGNSYYPKRYEDRRRNRQKDLRGGSPLRVDDRDAQSAGEYPERTAGGSPHIGRGSIWIVLQAANLCVYAW